MTEQHTAGPWHHTLEHDGHKIEARDALICQLYDFAETTKNAALIASAPDMLEVLQRIYRHEMHGLAGSTRDAIETVLKQAMAL